MSGIRLLKVLLLLVILMTHWAGALLAAKESTRQVLAFEEGQAEVWSRSRSEGQARLASNDNTERRTGDVFACYPSQSTTRQA
jgi:hypothetical protein